MSEGSRRLHEPSSTPNGRGQVVGTPMPAYDLRIHESEAPVLMQAFRLDDPIVDASLVRASSIAVVASISNGGWLSLEPTRLRQLFV